MVVMPVPVTMTVTMMMAMAVMVMTVVMAAAAVGVVMRMAAMGMMMCCHTPSIPLQEHCRQNVSARFPLKIRIYIGFSLSYNSRPVTR